jgi:hypothetical protein
MRMWVSDLIHFLIILSLEWIFEEGEIGYRIKSADSNAYIGYSLGESLRDQLYVTGNEHPVEYEIEGNPVTRYKCVCS